MLRAPPLPPPNPVPASRDPAFLANERPVCCASGMWITRAVGRVRTGECHWHIWLWHAKCGGLEKYPSSLHWIGKSAYEL